MIQTNLVKEAVCAAVKSYNIYKLIRHRRIETGMDPSSV